MKTQEGYSNLEAAMFASGSVPIPNVLFDQVMPQLGDTELRVLLVVLRQTLGWREGSDLGGWRFKRRDWITHRQLVHKTGRGSEAVSGAVNSLVSAGLIVVEDREGRPLSTAAERRRFMGRLYFRPVDKWITRDSSHTGKPKTTTNNWNNIKAKEHQRNGVATPAYPQSTGEWQRAVQLATLGRSASGPEERLSLLPPNTRQRLAERK